MVKMHGPECVRIVRNDFNYQGLIVGVTGNTDANDLREFRRSGVNHVLMKPIVISDLIAKFREFHLIPIE